MKRPSLKQGKLGLKRDSNPVPIARDVEDVQLGAVAQLVGQVAQLVVAQREDVEGGQVAHFNGQFVQSVAVHVQVRQLRQVANRRRQLVQKVLRKDQLLQRHAPVAAQSQQIKKP